MTGRRLSAISRAGGVRAESPRFAPATIGGRTTKTPSRARVWLGALLVAGLLVRIVLAEYVLANVKERLPDSDLYEAYARCIYQGDDYRVGDSRALRMPGYPTFLAGCWRLAGGEHSRAVLYAQAVLGTLTGWIVYRLAHRFEEAGAPRGTAWTATAIMLFEPYSLIMGSLELSETLFTTLFAGCVYFAAKLARVGSATNAFLLGVTGALAIYVRPSALLLAPIAALAALASAQDRTSCVRWIIVCSAAMSALLAPWWIRNARLYGRPVLTTLNVGESLYDGWNPEATGASDMTFKNDPEIPPMSELERDNYWRGRAMEFARENPEEVMALAVRKFARFWSPWPNEARFRTPAVTAITTIASTTLAVLAILGVAAAFGSSRENRLAAWMILIPAVYYTAIHGIFVSSVRYRVPLVPLLALAAGWGCAWLLGVRRTRLAKGMTAT